MINRRNFLVSGALVAGAPVLSLSEKIKSKTSTEKPFGTIEAPVFPRRSESYYISHRGVHLRQAIAGENTLESLRYAKRSGFQCVEFDVQFTKDRIPVVIHDDTINRTLARRNGVPIDRQIKVSELTAIELRQQYVVKCHNPKYRNVVVPTLDEYLTACNLYKVIPFIELKVSDLPDDVYIRLIQKFEHIVGRGNFVVTSNNAVNDRLRNLGYNHPIVMGILYQTTFERITGWGNSIMAISASRFNAQEYRQHTERSRSEGIPTESHADSFASFNQLIRYGTDYISTDLLAPDSAYLGTLIREFDMDATMDGITFSGKFQNGVINLNIGSEMKVDISQGAHYLYGVFFEIEFSGHLQGTLNNHVIDAKSDGYNYYRYQVLLHRQASSFQVRSLTPTTIRTFRIKSIKY